MGPVTRCPACGTMFRVADAQLAAAQGWVRCGQCADVFEAALHWVDDGGSAAHAGAAGPASGSAPAVPTSPPASGSPAPVPPFPPPEAESPEPPDLAPEPGPAQEPEVSFVQAARRNEFWRSAPVRAALGLACLALLAALLVQWLVHEKDLLAAREPRLAPALQALCRPLGCEVRPLRRIESLVIDNASFSRSATNAYRLSFVFRNTGDAAIEMPALEITLTDRQEQVLVRRVVLPAQFGATADTLPAHGEQAGALALKITGAEAAAASPAAPAGQLPVTGYRILAFYP